MEYPFPRERAQRHQQRRRRQARRRRPPSSQQQATISADPLLAWQPERPASPRGDMELLETVPIVKPGAYVPPQQLLHHQQYAASSLVPSREVRAALEELDVDEFDSVRLPLLYDISSQEENQNPAVDLAIPFLSHGCFCCQCVRTQEVGFTEDCGRFERMLSPGCYCLPWPYTSIAGRLSLRIQQLDVTCETKTADSVFCHVTVAVLFRVAVLHSYEAFYRLPEADDPCLLIQACVLDVLRSTIPASMTVDQLFVSQQEIAEQVFARLASDMLEYGYEITSTLVTNITPSSAHVKESMNEINASRRVKEAASHKAEAQKVARINQAQAAAERDYLHGVGISQQRQAIVQGMQESIQMWREMDVRVVDPPDQRKIMELLLVVQYLDTLEAVSSDDLFMVHGPAELDALRPSVPS